MTEFSYTPSVEAAKKNDQNAFSFLYYKSYDILKREALKYMKNDFDADDVLQNTYISIFKNISTLAEPEKFIPWSLSICRHYCINECVRRNKQNERTEFRPTVSDEEHEGLDTLPVDSYDCSVSPEAAVDAAETKRLLGEMIDDLPIMQKTCILLWQEKYSTKEISEMTGLPSGTVNSNVSYAKKKIKEKVLRLEKQGTKLYGLAPIPFFLWIVSQYSACYAPNPAAEGAVGSFSSVQTAINTVSVKAGGAGSVAADSALATGAAEGTKAAAIGAGAATAGGLSKGIIGLIAVIAAAGGITAGVIAYNSLSRDESAEANAVSAAGADLSVPEGAPTSMPVLTEKPDMTISATPEPAKPITSTPSPTTTLTPTAAAPSPARTPAPTSAPEPTPAEEPVQTIYSADSYYFEMPEKWQGIVDVEVDGDEMTFTWHDVELARVYALEPDELYQGEGDPFNFNVSNSPGGGDPPTGIWNVALTDDGKGIRLVGTQYSYLIPSFENNPDMSEYRFISQLSEEEKQQIINLTSDPTISLDECRDAYTGYAMHNLTKYFVDYYSNVIYYCIHTGKVPMAADSSAETSSTDEYSVLLSDTRSFLSGEKSLLDTLLNKAFGLVSFGMTIDEEGYFIGMPEDRTDSLVRGNYYDGTSAIYGKLFYAIEDLNNDGKNECLFSWAGNNNYPDNSSYIEMLWTLDDSNEPVFVIGSNRRSYVSIYPGGIIAEYISMNDTTTLYSLSSEGTLETIPENGEPSGDDITLNLTWIPV